MLQNQTDYDLMNTVETIFTLLFTNFPETDKWQRDFLVELFIDVTQGCFLSKGNVSFVF
jgi:hypothetical protein